MPNSELDPNASRKVGGLGSLDAGVRRGTGWVGALLYRGFQSSCQSAASKYSSMICFLRDNRYPLPESQMIGSGHPRPRRDSRSSLATVFALSFSTSDEPIPEGRTGSMSNSNQLRRMIGEHARSERERGFL